MKIYEYSPKENGNIETKQNIKLVNKITNFFLMVLAFVCIAMVAFSSFFYSSIIVGTSMTPTLNSSYDGSEESCDTAYYTTLNSANRGDIIIVDYASIDMKIDAIKRLIAKGGDKICFYQHHIILNGVPLKEDYLSSYAQNRDCKIKFDDLCQNMIKGTGTDYQNAFYKAYPNCITYDKTLQSNVLTIPEGYVFVLGDNRANSFDSSMFGPILEKYIVAKVEFVVPAHSNLITYAWQQFLQLF